MLRAAFYNPVFDFLGDGLQLGKRLLLNWGSSRHVTLPGSLRLNPDIKNFVLLLFTSCWGVLYENAESFSGDISVVDKGSEESILYFKHRGFLEFCDVFPKHVSLGDLWITNDPASEVFNQNHSSKQDVHTELLLELLLKTCSFWLLNYNPQDCSEDGIMSQWSWDFLQDCDDRNLDVTLNLHPSLFYSKLLVNSSFEQSFIFFNWLH